MPIASAYQSVCRRRFTNPLGSFGAYLDLKGRNRGQCTTGDQALPNILIFTLSDRPIVSFGRDIAHRA
jgi:hypothetical protein